MGWMKRAASIVEAKVNRLLDRLEDPNETLDLSYEKLMDGLAEVRRSLADVVTEQKQLELQMQQVEAEVRRREEEARAAVRAGRDDLAAAALDQKHRLLEQLEQMKQGHERIAAQAERLKAAERRFQDRVQAFRTQKEVTKATYNAAAAEVRMSESLSGIRRELGDVGEALRRANEKAEQMTARAMAMEQLHEEGILEDPLDQRDRVARELEDLRRQSAVEEELAALKRELGV
ncbi:hypothetical protein GCM10010885_10380 [Alicyclobacillus cellulosilyticus]|uniref:Phage shock protein A (PspA) family protein n=1 Tax=Alicyclobacillus cellulosilyticus TaxID=1003997 RepID=A0A917K8Z1_9BACL|nr:PspA/IM30 family protein [Alicyclobacillus cellulosilyticus]GGJ03027.1 hypothetical protein GCM10010885_10380 [Alicyclobacillus cellulosilyticus]